MTEAPDNPYAPASIDTSIPVSGSQWQLNGNWVAFLCWPFALLLNSIVPCLVGREVSSSTGWMGMSTALVMMLVAGWAFCLARPIAARKLVLGSMLFAWTQVFPVMQLFAGMVAYMGLGMIGSIMGFTRHTLSAPAAFIVAMLMAAMLIPPAAGLGWLAANFLPPEWFEER